MLPTFIAEAIPQSGEFMLAGDEARHAINVSRVRVGEHLSITDGAGVRAEVEVVSISKKNLDLRIIKRELVPCSKTRLVVVQALTKGDRAREAIELLTEGGVNQIIPWQASRSIGNWREDHETLEKWRMWGREATKQSRRAWFPEILELHSTEAVVNRIKEANSIFMLHESGAERISDAISGDAPDEIVLIIGPEGGISDGEAELFIGAGARSVLMGAPILRAAHAGLAALAAVQTGYRIW